MKMVKIKTEEKLEVLWSDVLEKISPPITQSLFKQMGSLLNLENNLAIVGLKSPALAKLNQKNQARISHLEMVFSQVTGRQISVKLVVEDVYLEESNYQKVIKNINKKKQNQLTSEQKTVLEQLKKFSQGEHKMFRLTGFAGTGKTFLITRYIQWLIEQEINFVAATPTNKAAKNLAQIAESSDLNLNVKTVAQLLGQQPVLDEEKGVEVFLNKDNLDWSGYGVIIIDEFSMVNKENFKAIASEVNSSLLSKVVFVGDSAQLPPVGESEPIVSMALEISESATLTEVVRYEGEIATVAEQIRSNSQYSRRIYPFKTTKDSTIICLPQEEWLNRAIAYFKSKQFGLNPDYVRFLAWRNKTVDGLNEFVRARLWGENAPSYVPGDRLIAKRPLFRVKAGQKGKNKWGIAINNSEEVSVVEKGVECELLFDGQIYKYWKVMVEPDRGKIQPLSILHGESKRLYAEQVKYLAGVKQWQKYYDLSRMFDDVGYAYALTTHKAQGSTIDYVFLDVSDLRGSSDRQKLQYTALTRAKTRVLIRG